MRIVVDTNIIISGIFFGGYPREILLAIEKGRFDAYASMEIIEEYQAIVTKIFESKQGHLDNNLLQLFIKKIHISNPISKIDICRDPYDNKFIECAKDANAIFIISGDKDLLVIKQYEKIKIVTAKEFYDKFLR